MKNCDQLFQEADSVKERLLSQKFSISNSEILSLQLQLQAVYTNLLVSWQDVALEKGVEKELWNSVFRPSINQLQAEANDKQGNGNEAKDMLNWFLNAASGFYIQLFNQICSMYSLDFTFRRKDSFYGSFICVEGERVLNEVNKNKVLYLCQYCLIHLGDLSRYRFQARQAETFYKHAMTVYPDSGHPYNQLALLEAGRGNRLAAISLYIRSLCVSTPFRSAASNLLQTFSKILSTSVRCDEMSSGSTRRVTKDEYINLFLLFHANLYLKGDEASAKLLLQKLCTALSTLVATNALTKNSLLQMIVIDLFSLHYFSGKVTIVSDGDTSQMKKESIKTINPTECSGIIQLLEDIIVGTLAALLLPVHTIKDADVMLTYPAFPAVQYMFEWVKQEDRISSSAMKSKQQIWPGLCKLVNVLQPLLINFNSLQYAEMPLPEDYDLQCFTPLKEIFSLYKFEMNYSKTNPETHNLLRASRLSELAIYFSQQTVDGEPVLKKLLDDSGSEKVIFEASCNENPSPDEVLALEQLSLQPKVQEASKYGRVGILKPQGSLEKAREGLSTYSDNLSCKTAVEEHAEKPKQVVKSRPRTNVALQAILKRNCSTQENKQVTFRTPSPSSSSPNPSEASVESQTNHLSTPSLQNTIRVPSPHPLASQKPSPPANSQQMSGRFSSQSNLPPGPWAWRNQPPPLGNRGNVHNQPNINVSSVNANSVQDKFGHSMKFKPLTSSLLSDAFAPQSSGMFSAQPPIGHSPSSRSNFLSEPVGSGSSIPQMDSFSQFSINDVPSPSLINSFLMNQQRPQNTGFKSSSFNIPQQQLPIGARLPHPNSLEDQNISSSLDNLRNVTPSFSSLSGNWWQQNRGDAPPNPVLTHLFPQRVPPNNTFSTALEHIGNNQQFDVTHERNSLFSHSGIPPKMPTQSVSQQLPYRQSEISDLRNRGSFSLFGLPDDLLNSSNSHSFYSPSFQLNSPQSPLWSGVGPSPLERLLEQKKSSGTLK